MMTNWIDQFKNNLLEVLYRGQPRDELGRFASTGGAGAAEEGSPGSVAAQTALIERITQDPSVEHLVVADASGEIVAEISGTNVEAEAYHPSLLDENQNLAHWHYHPDNDSGSFSDGDLVTFTGAPGIKEMGVVLGDTGDAHVMTKPEGWKADQWEKHQLTPAKIRDDWNAEVNRLFEAEPELDAGETIYKATQHVTDKFEIPFQERRMSGA